MSELERTRFVRRALNLPDNVSISFSHSESYSEFKNVTEHERYQDQKLKEHDQWWKWWIRNTPDGEKHALSNCEWAKKIAAKYGYTTMAEVDAFYDRFSKLRQSQRKNCKVAQMSDDEFIRYLKEH